VNQGPGGYCLMKKPKVENLVTLSLEWERFIRFLKPFVIFLCSSQISTHNSAYFTTKLLRKNFTVLMMELCRYQWLQLVPSSQQTIQRSNSPDLVLDSVAYTDQGDYVCEAFNTIGITPHSVMIRSSLILGI
jgi:hypothetical protein